MASEDKKDFNAMMNNNKNMPKIVEMTDEKAIKKWGGRKMIIAPPIYYDEVIKKIPSGKLVTTNDIRNFIAVKNKVDITCPLTAGIFINICAWASYQRKDDVTPYWRVLKSNGELNSKYPEAYDLQKKLLENEGHKVIPKGKTNIVYVVEDYEKSIYKF
jgi:alkylated DNA nucleotide flippase Atl1